MDGATFVRIARLTATATAHGLLAYNGRHMRPEVRTKYGPLHYDRND